jgi:fumarylacetoacetase
MSSASWLEIPSRSHFSLANIPFGIITTPASTNPHAGVAIGDHVLDLSIFTETDGFAALETFTSAHTKIFSHPTLNEFAAIGQTFHRSVRSYLQNVFALDTTVPQVLRDNDTARKCALFHKKDVKNHLPMKIEGYTDFFAGKNHAQNCGRIFRDPLNPLQPNYLHLPVGYSSRASSVVVSGTPIWRPQGQFIENRGDNSSHFGPCRSLDIELELGVLLCKGNEIGRPISVDEAEEYIFGFVILNDWSARDIQAWEAMPLGPFNAKNFASSISPWVVLKDAIEPFHAEGIPNETGLHAYLRETRTDNMYDVNLEVNLKSRSPPLPMIQHGHFSNMQILAAEGRVATLTRTNGKNLVFSFAQMLAHHTIGGCPMQVGDLIGSGTISGTEPGSLGSLLEASAGGGHIVLLPGGIERKFLEDGDSISIRAWCGKDESRLVGFGVCEGTILPAREL